MSDSYHTIGAARDRAAQAAREERMIEQLTRIADLLETVVGAIKVKPPETPEGDALATHQVRKG